MSKDTKKPSFTTAPPAETESTGWATRDSAVSKLRARLPRRERVKAKAETVLDVVTYPASFAVTMVLFPVARVAAWWRE
jgi:hypothetical protein